MEQPNITPGKFSMNYGLMLGLVMIVINVLMYVTGMTLEGKQWPQFLYYLIFPVTIFYAVNQFKKKNGNVLSLGQAIKTGLIIAIISALVFSVYSLIFHYVIDPDFVSKVMEVTREKMMENPNMTEEQVDQSMAFAEKFMNPFLGVTFWIALSAIFGLIYSLIAGLIMKNEQ